MKISPIYIQPIKKFNYTVQKSKKEYYSNPITKLRNIYYPVSFCGLSNEYKPISAKIPNYNLLNCDYSDLDKFSKLFTEKINSQLRTIEISDVKALVNRIKLKTGADNKLINEVLFELTQFSNYSAIDFFQKIANEFSTINFGVQQEVLKDTQQDVSSNIALNYFSRNKEFIRGLRNEKSLIVLDNLLIDQLENSKRENELYYKKFKEDLKRGKATLLNLKGWDIECSDKKYRSAAFLYGTGNLEDLAVDTIKRIQKGEVLDDILYKNIEKKLINLIGDDIDKNSFTIHRYQNYDKSEISIEDIYENIKIPELKEEKIKSAVQKILGEYCECKDDKTVISALTKYLDEMSIAYSFDTINSNLREINKYIEKKHGDNVIYSIMTPNKSTGLISHLYAHTNNISQDKFYGFAQDYKFLKAIKNSETTTFILDDISASGETINKCCSKAKALRKYNVGLLNYALLTTTKTAREVYDDCNFKLGYMYNSNEIKDIRTYKDNLLTKQELNLLNRLLNCGYSHIGLSVVYPYIIPDNCSDFSAEIFNGLLIKENEKSNKALSYSIDNV